MAHFFSTRASDARSFTNIEYDVLAFLDSKETGVSQMNEKIFFLAASSSLNSASQSVVSTNCSSSGG